MKTLLYPQCACSNELDASAFGQIGAKLKEHGGVRPPFWILTVEWSVVRSCRHRFQIASFSPSTLQNSVFKKHRFQFAPLWRAFSNGSVFRDCFRRCSVDDSRIRSKTAPFLFENGLVWTGTKNTMRVYAAELICSTGVLKPCFACIINCVYTSK